MKKHLNSYDIMTYTCSHPFKEYITCVKYNDDSKWSCIKDAHDRVYTIYDKKYQYKILTTVKVPSIAKKFVF